MAKFKLSLLAVAFFMSHQGAYAQQAIGAGGIIQQIPGAPAQEKSTPSLPIERRVAPAKPAEAGPRIAVNRLHVTGETHFSEEELLAVTGFRPGTELSLGELRAIAAKITGHYNDAGYFVAQAYLPPQDIKDGVVTIAVIEGLYGHVSLMNQSHARDGVIEDVLNGLDSGDPVVTSPLERRLLLISDIPGVTVQSTLSPGTNVGTSDLLVNAMPGQRVTGSVEADNWGNRYTGAYRLGGSVNFNEPFGYGDVLGARYLGSTSGGLNYGHVFYQAQLEDATLGAAYTIFDYHLGKEFSALDASGSEQIASLYVSYPLIRSYDDNLYALIDVDFRTFQDEIGVTFSTVDKQAYVVIAGLSGDSHDHFGGGGWNAYSFSAALGNLDIQSPLARAADAATARTNGTYAKFAFSASRLQHVYGPLSLYGSVRGQFAADNLDISEKMELGGAYGVRAYPEGESYGDQGYVATLEARLLLPKWPANLPGTLQLIGFVDTGSVTLNKSPWYSGRNEETRSGIGTGLTWGEAGNFDATVAYAHALGDQRATSAPDRFGRFWVRAVKYF